MDTISKSVCYCQSLFQISFRCFPLGWAPSLTRKHGKFIAPWTRMEGDDSDKHTSLLGDDGLDYNGESFYCTESWC